MAITSAYGPTTMVNGFACRNCTDIDYAKKHIDPAHPKDGPYGINADPAAAARSGSAPSGSAQLGSAPDGSRGLRLNATA